MATKPHKPILCLPNYGIEYNGDLSVTIGGHTCLPWSLPEVKTLSRDKEFIPEVQLQTNKCRNPDSDSEGPWCYVRIAGNITMDYCDLQLCGRVQTYNPLLNKSTCLPAPYLSNWPPASCRCPTIRAWANNCDRRQGALRLRSGQEKPFQSSHVWTRRGWWVHLMGSDSKHQVIPVPQKAEREQFKKQVIHLAC